MKKACLVSVILFAALCIQREAKANYAAGGELIFVHIADSTYQFFFKLYRDCSGNAEPDSIPLCFSNPCNNSSFSRYMTKWTGTGGSTIIRPLCSVGTTNCDSPASLIQAYKEIWYATIVTMPGRCNSWHISTRMATRNSIDNFQNSASSAMHIEARMNNSTIDNNSSPFYSIRPPYGVPFNQNYTFNNGGIDPDGDSLWHDLIMPRTGTANCTDTPVSMIFSAANPQYNLVTNPFQTGHTFSRNGSTGQMTFTSKAVGRANVVVRTREYRNGVLIGSIMREVQMRTIPFPAPPIYSTNNTCPNPPTSNGKVFGCANQNLSYCFYYKSSDSNSRIFLLDNLATTIPGANITYVNQGTDSVHVTFSWTPGLNDVGNSSYIIFITDSMCNFPVPLQYASTVEHIIWGPVKAGNDTTICRGQPAFLSVSGGAIYQWTVLSGSQNSLSNPNVANPVATPAVTTTYIVTSTINPYCPGMTKDTVTVTVNSNLTYPYVKTTVMPDSNIQSGVTVLFTATAINCSSPAYQWRLNGNDIPGATNKTLKLSTVVDEDNISCRLTCADSCASPGDTFSKTITMHVSAGVNALKSDFSIGVFPNPNDGLFSIETGVTGNPDELPLASITNVYGQVVYLSRVNPGITTINLRDQPPGVYILKLNNEATRIVISR